MRENSIEQLKITEKQFKNEADKKVKELFSKAGAEDDEEISRDDVITDEIKASTEARQKQLKKDWSEAERKEAAREDEEATVSEETEPKEKEPKEEGELEKYKIIETEALKDRSMELWDERSKILMEKSSQGRTDKFQAIEEEMTEIREELKGRSVKFELNKWMKEKEEEKKAENGVVGKNQEETVKESGKKTAEEALKELRIEINVNDIKSELEYKIKAESVKIEYENEKAINELLDKLNLEQSEKENIKNNIELTLNSALDAEAEREFSKLLKHHKGVLAVGIGVGALAGLCSAGARMLGGGWAMKAGKIAGGAALGTGAGILRGKIRQWMNPAIEAIRKKNAPKLKKIREEKSKKLFVNDNLKIVTVQEIRRAVLDKFLKGEENIAGNKDNALNIIKNNKEFNSLQLDEQEKLAKSIAVLTGVMNENSKRLGELLEGKTKKGMSEVKKSALLGGTIGGAVGIAQSITDSPYMPAIAGGAIGGIMMGRAIDIAWAKKEIEKKSRKMVEKIDIIGSAKEKEVKDLSRLKSYLESGVLDKYPLAREKAKQILMDEMLKPAIEINQNEVEKENKELEKEFTRSKAKKMLSYAAGIGGGIATGVAGRLIFEQAKDLVTVKTAEQLPPDFSESDKDVLKTLDNLSDDDKEYIAKHGLHDYNIRKTLEAMPLKPEEAVEEASPLAGELPDDKIKDVPPETLEKIKKIVASQEALKEVAAKAAEQEVTIKERIGLATIKKGEGIEHALIRQLKADPEKFGFKGDPNNTATVKKWAGIEAHRTAIKAGYVDAESGHEIRVGTKGINKAAYVLEKDADGNVKVHEYFKGEDIEEHKLAEDFKGAEFEGKGKENYEYIHENKGVAQEVAVEEAEVKPVATESGVVAETAESAPIIEVWSNETREKLEQILNVENITSDDVEKINKIVNLEDGIQPKEESLLKFLAEHKTLINEPKFFEFSEKTGIKYDKPHFLEIYNNMPEDIKFNSDSIKAEGYLQVFAGEQAQIVEGLSKLGIEGEIWTKREIDGVIIIKNVFGKEGFDVLLSENKLGVDGPMKWNWGTKGGIFNKIKPNADLTMSSIVKVKSEIVRMYNVLHNIE